MVTKPSRGSLTRVSSMVATMTLMRSASLRARGLSDMGCAPPEECRSGCRGAAVADAVADAMRGAEHPAGLGESERPRRLREDAVADGARSAREGADIVGSSLADVDRAPVRCPAQPVSDAGLLLHLVGRDDVLELEVVERAQVDTALVALADLGDIVLEASQTGHLDVLGDHDTLAGDARLGAALDEAAAHDRTGDVAELGGAEDLADLRRAELDLLVLRLEHALEGLLDLVDG